MAYGTCILHVPCSASCVGTLRLQLGVLWEPLGVTRCGGCFADYFDRLAHGGEQDPLLAGLLVPCQALRSEAPAMDRGSRHPLFVLLACDSLLQIIVWSRCVGDIGDAAALFATYCYAGVMR